MNRTLAAILATIAALPFSSTATAQEMGAAKCAAPVTPGDELAPWAAPRPLHAAASAKRLASATLPVGQAAAVTLLQTGGVRYPLRPEKPGGSVSYGGLFGLNIMQAGTYRVALSSGAWIDMVKAGKPVTSIGHGHGPDCTGIRKMVDFPLEPGRYTLQLGANGAAGITVLVARLP